MKIKLIILIALFLLVVGIVVGTSFMPTKIPVLTYHDFTKEEPENSMQIKKEVFEEEMKYLHDHHYHTLKLEDIECFLENTCKIPKKSVFITMDDGWISELKIAAPILKKYNLNATIFYIGENYDGHNKNFMDKESLEELKKNYPNIEVASHSYALHYEDTYLLSKEELIEDIKVMKEISSSKYYAYPYGRYSSEYIEALKEEGYSLAFGFGPSKEHRKLTKEDNPYTLPRLNISNGMPLWKFILRLNWYQ